MLTVMIFLLWTDHGFFCLNLEKGRSRGHWQKGVISKSRTWLSSVLVQKNYVLWIPKTKFVQSLSWLKLCKPINWV